MQRRKKGVLLASVIVLSMFAFTQFIAPARGLVGTHKITAVYYKAYIHDDHDWDPPWPSPDNPGDWYFRLYWGGEGGSWTSYSNEYERDGPGTVDFTDIERSWDISDTEYTWFVTEAREKDPLGWDENADSTLSVSIGTFWPDRIPVNVWHSGDGKSVDVTHYYKYFIQNLPPTVGSITGPSSGRMNVAYTFSTTGSDPEGDSCDYEWSVNSVIQPATGPSLTYTFPTAGTYTVKVRTRDFFGAYSTFESKTMYVCMPTIESCDSTGAKKDTFNISEDVYVIGSGFLPSEGYYIYVVRDRTWIDGDPFPVLVPWCVTQEYVFTDTNGNIPTTVAWNHLGNSPLSHGKYDIVVETALEVVGEKWVYDVGIDALDDGDICGTAGFFVVSDGISFDFGTPDSPVEPDWTQATESTAEPPTRLGHGWTSTAGLVSRDRGAPDDLRRDFVSDSSDHTFNIYLMNGDYQVTVIIGDQNYGHDRIDVYAEDILVIDDLTVPIRTFTERDFFVTVDDAHLNIRFHDDGGSDANWIINALIIVPFNPFNEWFRVLDEGYLAVVTPFDSDGDDLNDSIEVRMDVNTDDCTLDVTVEGVLLAPPRYLPCDTDVATWTITGSEVEWGILNLRAPPGGPEGWYDIELTLYDDTGNLEDYWLEEFIAYLYPPAFWLGFDFGTATSPVEPGFIRITHSNARDRGAPDALRRDFIFDSVDRTFTPSGVPNGEYDVTVIIGDQNYMHDRIDVYAEGVLKINDLTVAAGTFQEITFTVTVTDGELNFRFHDDGGTDRYWVVNALIIEAAAPPSDEWFQEVDYIPWDSDGDGLDDSLDVWIDVNTDDGTLDVTVEVSFIDPFGFVVYTDTITWTITGEEVEYGTLTFSVPSGGLEGWYDVELTLFDDTGNLEDYRYDEDVAYLYPPAEVFLLGFDFGTPDSPVSGGWTQATESTLYSDVLTYGWTSIAGLVSRDRGWWENLASDDLRRDFVFSSTDRTFNVDVPNGHYQVIAKFYERRDYMHDRIDVYAEGNLVINDLTVPIRTFTDRDFFVTVDDGQLNIRFHDDGGSDANWIINALKLGIVPGTLFVSIDPSSVSMILGESQTFTSSVSGGTSPYTYQWFLDGTPVPGATASTWTFTPDSTGTYEVYVVVTDSIGDTAQSNTAPVTVTTLLVGFDFGTATSPVEPGFIRITHSNARDRGAPDALRRDFIFDSVDRTFTPFGVSNGEYDVTVIIGDQNYMHDLIDVYAEGTLKINDLTVAAGTFQEVTFTVTVTDGELNFRFHDEGGSDANWIVNAITIESLP